MLNHHNQMGKVDYCSLYLCGIRMNGVLIEWNSWLGYFIFFTYTLIYKNAVSYFT
jgi:hypothetical protein